MRDLGSIQSPQNAFLTNVGLETLHLRVKRHCENAQKVAEYLKANDKVSWVRYSGLPGDDYYEVAQKYLPNGMKANGQTCPNCGQETLIYQEGCLICTSCGTSKCG